MLPGTPEEAADLRDSCELLWEDGFDAAWDGARLSNPADGELDPLLAVRALAELAGGTSVREHAYVCGGYSGHGMRFAFQ